MRLIKLLFLLPLVLILLTLGVGFFQAETNYQVGRLIERNPFSLRILANYWYTRAARMGYEDALSLSGLYYLFGYAEQDKRLGIEFLERASKKKSIRAMSSLATAFEWGLGVDLDLKRCYDLREAILKEDKNAMRNHSMLAYLRTVCPPPIRDFNRGLQGYEGLVTLGEQEDNPAEPAGLYHYYGLTGKPDRVKAVQYLKQGAALGATEARAVLGACYLRGEGVKKDYKTAANLLSQAARCGDLDSQMLLYLANKLAMPEFDDKSWGTILEKRGFKFHKWLNGKQYQSPQKAVGEIADAAKIDKDAATIYGVMYLNGFLLPESSNRGREYLDSAIASGSLDAAVLKAYEALHYPGDPEAMGNAIAALKEGGSKGHAFSAVQYASYSATGTYSKQSWDECFAILKDANLDLEPSGRFLLAQCYLYGLGTECEPRKGLEEVRAAARLNHPSAYTFMIENYYYYDRRYQIELNMEEFARESLRLDLPKIKYLLAIRLPREKKEESMKLLAEAASAGFLDAQVELAQRFDLMDKKEEAVRFYRMAVDGGRLDVLKACEALEAKLFMEQFKRESGSAQVLIASREIKEGAAFATSDFDLVDSSSIPSLVDRVSASCLDGSDRAREFLIGKHCLSKLKKGDPISVYDIGVTEEVVRELRRQRMRKLPGI